MSSIVSFFKLVYKPTLNYHQGANRLGENKCEEYWKNLTLEFCLIYSEITKHKVCAMAGCILFSKKWTFLWPENIN